MLFRAYLSVVVVVITIAAVSIAGAIPADCDDPTLPPSHLLSRPITMPPFSVNGMDVGRERIFVATADWKVHSYTLNGGTASVWNIDFEEVFTPVPEVHPLTGEVFVWGRNDFVWGSGSNPARINVYDPDSPNGTSAPSRWLFDPRPTGLQLGALRTAKYIAFHPVTGALYV